MSARKLLFQVQWLLVILVCLCAVPAFAAPVQHAFLVQNSGWMEPFYTDSRSKFKPLVAAVANSAVAEGDTVHVLAFNQSYDANISPQLLGSGQSAGNVGALLAPLQVARKSAHGSMADTDFKEAVAKTISNTFSGRPGILWIFTNNKNSPGNDPETAKRNQDFYDLLHNVSYISRTVVYPIRMPVEGRHYRADGLAIYALAYGEEAGVALDSLIQSGRLANVLKGRPARLKPINSNGVSIVSPTVQAGQNVEVSLAADNRTLVVDTKAASWEPRLQIRSELLNSFYPYAIKHGNVSAVMTSTEGQTSIEISPAQIRNLQPGQSQQATLDIVFPIERVPSVWSWISLRAMGKEIVVPMQLKIQVTEQSLAVSEEFSSHLAQLFPGDPISEMFTPSNEVASSSVSLPVVVRVKYPLFPVFLVIGLGLLVMGFLAWLATLSSQSKRFEIEVDGCRKKQALKRFSTQTVRNEQGEVVGSLRLGFGQPQVVSQVEGHGLRVIK